MTVSWLHVSDSFKSGDPYDRDVVLRALVHSVAEFRSRGRQPDLIFATGDVAHSGQEDNIKPRPGSSMRFVPLQGSISRASMSFQVITILTGLCISVWRGQLERGKRLILTFGPSIPKPHITQKQRAFQQWYDQYFDGIRRFPQTSDLRAGGGCPNRESNDASCRLTALYSARATMIMRSFGSAAGASTLPWRN